MKISNRKRLAFSLLEVIAAVILLTVVATATLATIAPMRAKSEQKLNDQALASLNKLSQTYFHEHRQYPPRGANSLAEAGYFLVADEAVRGRLDNLSTKFSYDSKTGVFSKR